MDGPFALKTLFAAAREPLGTRERRLVFVTAIVVALTRFLAIAKTPWDWDEGLFGLALRHYDVLAHHPHPPGFPLFVFFAKAVQQLGLDEFRSLQSVSVAASLFVFPAMFFLARELRSRFEIAYAAALLLAFFPNVVLYGGMAVSDVLSLVLVVLACALLLRGCRSDAALVAGAIVLSIAAGVRPQNLLIGFAPALLALVRRPRVALLAALPAAAIIVTAYGVAAHYSGGWIAYHDAVREHTHYIARIDSYESPLRPSLLRVADDFFVRPYRMLAINLVLALMVLAGLITRRPAVLGALALFGPFAFFAWLFLDFHSASRFSLGYAPMMALLAAHVPYRRLLVPAIVAAMFAWTWPALQIVRTTASPPAAAIAHIPSDAVVYVDERIGPQLAFLAPRNERHLSGIAPPAIWPMRKAVLLREGESTAPGAMVFRRNRDPLAHLARDRYFETSLVPVHAITVREQSPTRLLLDVPPVAREAILEINASTATWNGQLLRIVDGEAEVDASRPATLVIEGATLPTHITVRSRPGVG